MKRFLTLLASLSLLAAFSSALAFADVPADAWYADSVALCQESGLMKGTGPDAFSPEGGLTLAEVMTVSARLHYRAQGGTGAFPTAPAEWGTGSLATPSGAVLLTFNTCDLDRGLTYTYDSAFPRRLHLYLEVTPQELAALTPAGGPAEAVLTLNGKQTLTGGLAPAEDGSSRMEFTAGAGSDYTAFNRELSSFLPAPASGLWYRDALWYARENGLLDAQPKATAFEDPATRLDLVEWLVSALPVENFAPINTIAALPDTQDPEALLLFRAGILTGVDELGSFGGEQDLTRAELAVVLARITDPTRRVRLNTTGIS